MIDWLRRQRPADAPTPPPLIELAGRKVPVILKRNARAKRMTMRLAPDGAEIRITLPRWALRAEALEFVTNRRTWLETELARIPAREPVGHASTIIYRGKNLAINWQEKASRRPQRSGDQLILGGPRENLAGRISRWLEREAHDLFAAELEEYCRIAGQSTPRLQLSRAQRRWGSCARDGTIRINWRLIQAPDTVRRSVIAHEVAHLVHFDHSPKFHALLARIHEGDIKASDRWLKQNGRGLYVQFG